MVTPRNHPPPSPARLTPTPVWQPQALGASVKQTITDVIAARVPKALVLQTTFAGAWPEGWWWWDDASRVGLPHPLGFGAHHIRPQPLSLPLHCTHCRAAPTFGASTRHEGGGGPAAVAGWAAGCRRSPAKVVLCPQSILAPPLCPPPPRTQLPPRLCWTLAAAWLHPRCSPPCPPRCVCGPCGLCPPPPPTPFWLADLV